ncbi:MAG: hypothetical protein V3V18_08670 [Methylococcales bacterium]
MEEIKIIVTGVLCGLIIIIGFMCQYKTFIKLISSFACSWNTVLVEIFYISSFFAIFAIPLRSFYIMIGFPVFEFGLFGHMVFSFVCSFIAILIIYVFNNDYYNEFNFEVVNNNIWNVSFFFPLILSIAVIILTLLGTVVSYTLSIVDDKISLDIGYLKKINVAIFMLSVLFLVKTFFSSIVLSLTLTWFVWNFSMHNEIVLVPIFSAVIDVMASKLPSWVGYLYVVLTIIYSITILFVINPFVQESDDFG